MAGIIQILCLIAFFALPGGKKDGYTASSVLSAGKWFRLAVTEDGVYRIDYSRLKQLGLDNPSFPVIFGNNHGQLSYNNNEPSPDDLREIKISLIKGADQVFNEGDYLIFYASGTARWVYNVEEGSFDHLDHNYSDTAFYFLTSRQGPVNEIKEQLPPAEPPDYLSSSFDELFIHEEQTDNILKSGREWFQPVSSARGITVNPPFTGLQAGEPVKYQLRVLARSSVSSLFRILEGTNALGTITVPAVNTSSYTGTYAQSAQISGSATPMSSKPAYEIRFLNNGEVSALGWLDYLILHGRKVNKFNGKYDKFIDSKSVAAGRVTGFSIEGATASVLVWDVTDPYNARKIRYDRDGEKLVFKARTDSLKTFIAFDPGKSVSPLINQTPLPNQDLHASEPADMIIVTHPLFREHAGRISKIHNKESGLVSLIVTPGQIYNEFSGGIPDIAAIRNFIRMKYLKQLGTGKPLRYLLLFGDGSYENKTPPPGNPNYIPTYQSENSNIVISSFTSDDFYGLLEDEEGEYDGTLDIGIGRLPVTDTLQAGIMVSKIEAYIDPSNRGAWKNVVSIAADDEDGNIHLYDAEGIAGIIGDSAPWAETEKIYFDSYKQVSSGTGKFYPDVTRAIKDRINSGALIFNYIGHGNENSLAHERVLTTEEISKWNNKNKLPLFITATCEFSRFDDISFNYITRQITAKQSAGEKVLLNSNGGGIAIMSTTRLAYSASNNALNRKIAGYAMTPGDDGKSRSLGDIVRLAKNNSGSSLNKRNFVLLGDPALKLPFPAGGEIITDSVNGVHVSELTDTLKALSVITITGHIEDGEGNLSEGFNGTLEPRIYGKEAKITTMANDGGTKVEYSTTGEIIFSGKTGISNGRFRFSFIVPADIDYDYGTGRINYYGYNSTSEINGYFNGLTVGGFSSITNPDTSGPVIKIYMNDTLFRNGGLTGENPRLIAIIEDKDGINISGNGTGHDIKFWLDGNSDESFVLNDYFENDFDSFTRGRVSYYLNGISPGHHTLTIKAWDNFNNSTEETIEFSSSRDGVFLLRNLLNYPNPFTTETSITTGHNRPEEVFDITITIFNTGGKLLRIIRTTDYSSGYQLNPVIWDGRDASGDPCGRGIFPYRVEITTRKGERAAISGKMIIL